MNAEARRNYVFLVGSKAEMKFQKFFVDTYAFEIHPPMESASSAFICG